MLNFFSFKKEFLKTKFDYYLVNTNDEFLNEYTPISSMKFRTICIHCSLLINYRRWKNTSVSGGFLVIAQYQSVRIGPEFEEMNPTSLPDLFKPLRTLDFP